VRRITAAATALAVAAVLLGACGSDDKKTTQSSSSSATANKVAISAKDYDYDVPATITGGLVEFTYKNTGKEGHFAGFAKAAAGKTFADVKAAITAPPSSAAPTGPPPFEEYGGLATTDPGGSAVLSLNLPAGTYAVFCLISGADGVSHAAKGMVRELTVTDGPSGELPAAAATITATDFKLDGLPALKAGTNVVRLHNAANQAHEINLVEVPAGKTIADAAAWFKDGGGPPPISFLGGVATKAGEDGTATFDLKSGSTYAFICALPDVLGDFAPHVTKGMATTTFTVS
jgi:uncharacterized cupredoxin-like copper-binding protein